MAATSYDDRITNLVGLPEAAQHLGVSSKTVRELVRLRRLPARRLGQLWYVERDLLEEFARTYQPRRPKPVQRRTSNTDSRGRVARLLAEWQSATADELAVGIGLHPGNVPKHLVILASAGVTERDDEGLWRLTAAGRRVQASLRALDQGFGGGSWEGIPVGEAATAWSQAYKEWQRCLVRAEGAN
jgi:excisionase family DNA binding protein